MKMALATVVDSRQDFYLQRKSLVAEELDTLEWLRSEFELVESPELNSIQMVQDFARRVNGAGALMVHIPIWADPVFTVKLASLLPMPMLLVGNSRPETSSLVGLLGAGGALDQIGRAHLRIFEHRDPNARRKLRAFIRAVETRNRLNGQTLGLFGGRSLGIFTAIADPGQWQRLFGVDIEIFDQAEIVRLAEALPREEVQRHQEWLTARLGGVRFGAGGGGAFGTLSLERQVRSYLATRRLVETHSLDFVGVKCQPELSDGYVSQCVAHTLFNGALDAGGSKPVTVHACESDADGALTMQILHLLSGGQPAALLDIRWFDPDRELWTLANCGALPAGLFATPADPSGLSGLHLEPHVFGLGGGGALSGVVPPQKVTLARLCRSAGEYWMAILGGQVETAGPAEAQRTTSAFPKAFVRTSAGADFLNVFGSNHVHMVSGDYVEELIAFCRLAGIRWQLWNGSGGS